MRRQGLLWYYETFGVWGVLDTVGHRLHLPYFIQDRICGHFDDRVTGGWK